MLPHRSLEPWEIDLILNNWRGRRAGIWMMAMLFCGIRRSEALAATLSSFDQETCEWRVDYSAHEERNIIVDSEKKRGKTAAAIRTIQVEQSCMEKRSMQHSTITAKRRCD